MTKKKQKVDWRVMCVGIVCLTGAEIYALSQGINGTIFSVFMMVIGAAIGLTIPSPLTNK